jgi:hypothetical protein
MLLLKIYQQEPFSLERTAIETFSILFIFFVEHYFPLNVVFSLFVGFKNIFNTNFHECQEEKARYRTIRDQIQFGSATFCASLLIINSSKKPILRLFNLKRQCDQIFGPRFFSSIDPI